MKTRIGCVAVLVSAMGMTADVAVAQEADTTPTPSQGTGTSVLRGFEKSVRATQQESEQNSKPRTEPSHKREHDEGIGSELTEEFGDMLGEAIVRGTATFLAEGGMASLQRLNPEPDSQLRRNEGEPLIPFVRYDYGYQRVSPNITGLISRFEGGYGPVALFLENYSLDERSPASTLNIKRYLLLYRMSNNSIEIDLGLGDTVITGVERTEMIAVPVRIRLAFNENFSMDLMFTGGDGMNDAEMALHVGRQFGSFKMGYRNLHSAGPSLGGPFAGVAFYF